VADAGMDVTEVDAPDVGGVSLESACGPGTNKYLGDFDGDGSTDCVTLAASPTHSTLLHKGLPGGTFRAEAVTSTGLCFQALSGASTGELGPIGLGPVGDFDGDGRDDLMLLLRTSTPSIYFVRLFTGHADGSFVCPRAQDGTVIERGLPVALYALNGLKATVADFTNDGIDDAVVSGLYEGATGAVTWVTLVGKSRQLAFTGSVTKSDLDVGFGGVVKSVSHTEANVDGRLDVVTTYVAAGSAAEKTVTWYGKGDGTFLKTPPPP
jgi:hypothetical protein